MYYYYIQNGMGVYSNVEWKTNEELSLEGASKMRNGNNQDNLNRILRIATYSYWRYYIDRVMRITARAHHLDIFMLLFRSIFTGDSYVKTVLTMILRC